MVDHGIGSINSGRAGKSSRARCDDIKFGSEASSESSEEGFEVRGKDEEIAGQVLLNCNIASLIIV